MASIYQRPDSKNFCLSCYPRPGAKLLRASLGTENEAEAEKVARTVELLIELEKYSDTKVPEKLLECLSGVRSMIGSAAEAASVQPSTEAITASAECFAGDEFLEKLDKAPRFVCFLDFAHRFGVRSAHLKLRHRHIFEPQDRENHSRKPRRPLPRWR